MSAALLLTAPLLVATAAAIRRRLRLRDFTTLAVSIAADEMVVNHTCRLHEGVHGRRTHVPEPSPHQILAQGFRLGTLHWDLRENAVGAHDGLESHKVPKILIERSALFHYL